MKNKIMWIVYVIFFFLILFLLYSKVEKKDKLKETTQNLTEDIIYNSNIIDNVNYKYKDSDNNEYNINAIKGEIDFTNDDTIYLTTVTALIKLNDNNIITITSDYGKYNTKNYDTIFSKNVKIDYLENTIIGGYLDFSMQRNSMIISKNVVYTNLENILKADVVEINIKTKDTKIFMYGNEKKVNIKSIN